MRSLLSVMIFIISSILFIILEYGQMPNSFLEVSEPVIFAFITAVIFLNGNLRKFVMWLWPALLGLMVIFYLINNLQVANWLGSLGVGTLVILVFSYLPNLIKNGHI